MLRYGTATNKLAQRRHRLDFRHYLIQSGSLAWTVCDVVAIGELAAGVAHEINNPLTIVAGFAEALMDCDLPQGAGSHAQRIYTESQRAAKIVNNLLAFARKRELSKRYIHLPDVLARAIEVQTCLPGGLPRTMADEHQLVQVILSILANAEQALTGTQNGGKIIINAAQVGEKVRVSISDNGPGIADEHIRRIFEPFYTTKDIGDGTGLGLSICYGILHQYGGEIWVESGPGLGATFHMELPILAPEELPAPPPQPSPGPVQGRSAPQRILVVDDEDGIRELMLKVLAKDGRTVEGTSDGEEALRLIAQRRYNCIIMDLKMPNLSGPHLYQRLAETDPRLAERVIFLTGDAGGCGTKEFLDSTAAPVMNKPFNLVELRKQIEELLAKPN